MTLTQTLDMVEGFLSYDLDGYDERSGTPTTAARVAAVNWAIRTVARRADLYDHNIPVTLSAGVGTYSLRSLPTDGRRIIKPRTVVVAGRPLIQCDQKGYGVWSVQELEQRYPRWRSDPAGETTKSAWIGQQLILHPAPDASTVAAGNHFVAGTYLPADMDAVTGLAQQLPLPVEVHEAVAYCAAVKLALPTTGESAGIARLQAFSAEWVGAIEELKRETAQTLTSWGTTTGTEGDDYVWI